MCLWSIIIRINQPMNTQIKNPGYHLTAIPKGVLGESSKILEEVFEFIDAEKQGCRIMILIELSDMIGAVELYLKKNIPDIKISDLERMSAITQRAFMHGHRK